MTSTSTTASDTATTTTATTGAPPSGGIGRAVVSVGSWTLVSRATGFLRLAVIGAVLGPTFLGNLFQTANQLPNLAFELVAGQLIASLLMPALVVHLDRDDRRAGERLAGGFLGLVLVLFGAVAVVLAAAGPLLVGLLGVGIDQASVRQDLTRLGWPLLIVVMPQLALYGFIGVANAVQNARHRFALAAAAPVLENVVVIAALIGFHLRGGGRGDLADASTLDVVLLGAGSTLGVVLHAALQWYGARRVGISLRPRAGWRDAEVRAIARLVVPSIGLAALTSLQTFACLIVVGSVAGGVVAFQLGLAFVATVVALGARPLTVAALPGLSRFATAGQVGQFRRAWARTLQAALTLLAPAAAGLIVLGPALGRALGVGAMDAPGAAVLLSAAIAGLGLAALGNGLTLFNTEASYARRDTGAPLRAAALATVVLGVGLAISFGFDDPATVVLGAALSTGVASLAGAWFLCRRVDRLLPGHSRLAPAFRRTLGFAVLASLPAFVATRALSSLGGTFGRLGAPILGGMVLLVGYVALHAMRVHSSGSTGRPGVTAGLRAVLSGSDAAAPVSSSGATLDDPLAVSAAPSAP